MVVEQLEQGEDVLLDIARQKFPEQIQSFMGKKGKFYFHCVHRHIRLYFCFYLTSQILYFLMINANWNKPWKLSVSSVPGLPRVAFHRTPILGEQKLLKIPGDISPVIYRRYQFCVIQEISVLQNTEDISSVKYRRYQSCNI